MPFNTFWVSFIKSNISIADSLRIKNVYHNRYFINFDYVHGFITVCNFIKIDERLFNNAKIPNFDSSMPN